MRTTGAATKIVSYTTGSYSTLRLQELLAQLAYLPIAWTASANAGQSTSPARGAQLSAAYDPPAG